MEGKRRRHYKFGPANLVYLHFMLLDFCLSLWNYKGQINKTWYTFASTGRQSAVIIETYQFMKCLLIKLISQDVQENGW